MKHLFCYLLHLEVVHLENIVDPSRNGIVSGPLFLGGGLILIIRTSNLRVKEKCERIKSEHNGVVNSLWFRCLRVSHHWALIGWFLMDHEISHAFAMSMMIAYLHNCFSNLIQLSALIPLTSTSPLAFTSPLTFTSHCQLLDGPALLTHNCFVAHPHHATTVSPSRLHFLNIVTVIVCPKVID